MSKVIELNDNNFEGTLKEKSLAFVDFYADWCGPCRLFAPVFSKVAEKNHDIGFFKIDGDLNPESRSQIEISNLPFVAAFRNGVFIEGFSTTLEASLDSFVSRIKESQ